MNVNNKTTVSLVLGSGGARGLAHIGVIHELLGNGYVIRSISGCSMGALVGGIFAAGKLDEFELWIRAITRVDMVSLLDIAWQRQGLVKGDRIIGSLVELVGDRLIEDLPVPFTAVAADVQKEKEVWINTGGLFDAIRASMSLPLFFTPVSYKDRYLLDGGILNPVPIAPTFDDDTDVTIAVNLGGRPEDIATVTKDRPAVENQSSTLRRKVSEYIERLQTSAENSGEQDWSAYEIADQAFDAMQSTIARQKLAAYPPDISIEIARNACGTLEFDRAAEMIELGRIKARESLCRARKNKYLS